MRVEPFLAASEQDGTYPRPQLVRDRWAELGGAWEFEFDDADAGRERGWHAGQSLSRRIIVPFPPESEASGIGETGYHRVLWYRRTVTTSEIEATGHADGNTLLLHFGAVDYRADVWVNGLHVVHHEGGHTPFAATVPRPGKGFEIVVRVEDDPLDLGQPRGKQDWAEQRHVVWYDRTSGIWQPVWLESVPGVHITHLAWRPDIITAEVRLAIELSAHPVVGTNARVTLRLGSKLLAEQTLLVSESRTTVVVTVDALRNGQAHEDVLWSPERPTLIDATVELEVPGQERDTIASYFGFRQIGEGAGRFLLNERPYDIRGVLSQGYWPHSHLAAPGPGALRAEVELIRELGFTTVRVHQKIEDPRFLYWTDRLGLLVWEEMPSTYEFSATASARLLAEWTEVIRRDASHPSIAVWVPFNESWGVHHVAKDPAQQSLVRAMYHLTKSLDTSRLVVSNDGWEHTCSDLLTIHDYENDPVQLLASYGTGDAVRGCLDEIAPNGRRMLVGTDEERTRTAARPVVLSEFGGVSIEPSEEGAWGYQLVESHEHLEQHLVSLFAAVRGTETLAGWCYTQLTDTAQETNGLTDEHRVPKIPVERIRAILRGEDHLRVPVDQR
ncbi:glycoside hydrolase family 2 TIM barrel-domain containing protein [Diaminobutyricibacter sp. McL0608]|uniref:glycoside hydrolase family 2 TIM barrel-domain containing protein n=1 Tax=Leifsonia sp. McL0608 TaxID=3143537 RepID=UPI0031F3365F